MPNWKLLNNPNVRYIVDQAIMSDITKHETRHDGKILALILALTLAGFTAMGVWISSAHAQQPAQVPGFHNEAQAMTYCAGVQSAVVWFNSLSHVYHYKGSQYYSRTAQGMFVCEKDAVSAGGHPSRTGQ